MKILYIGDNWLGSDARSMREALVRRLGPDLDDLGVDLIVPSNKTLLLRVANRLLRPFQEAEFGQMVLQRVADVRPDFIVVYKGQNLNQAAIKALKSQGPKLALIFPDYSPHAYGKELKDAVGEYDLVCSTKPFHPPLWKSIYGYDNKCVFVPHGYNPFLHFRDKPSELQPFDVVMVANGRPEYYELMQRLAGLIGGRGFKIAIAGPNWSKQQVALPNDWLRPGVKTGTSYTDWLRKGKIVIAPLHTRVVVDGNTQPADVDSSRTYNIPAANCFLIHRRTEFVKTMYDEETEMPMFDDAAELAEKIIFYSSRDSLRESFAMAAHARAIPAYSLDKRVAQIVEHLENL